MSNDVKKFLDEEGVKVLWNQVNLNDYPNNETLIAVINAIDETKANKEVVDILNEAITTKYSATNPPPYPVTSVDGKTGDIILNSEVWTFTLNDGSVVTKEVVIK